MCPAVWCCMWCPGVGCAVSGAVVGAVLCASPCRCGVCGGLCCAEYCASGASVVYVLCAMCCAITHSLTFAHACAHVCVQVRACAQTQMHAHTWMHAHVHVRTVWAWQARPNGSHGRICHGGHGRTMHGCHGCDEGCHITATAKLQPQSHYSGRSFRRSGDITSEPPCLWEFKISKAPYPPAKISTSLATYSKADVPAAFFSKPLCLWRDSGADADSHDE